MRSFTDQPGLDAMFDWAERWQRNQDAPRGPLELHTRQYVAAMARPLFIRAVAEHCPTAIDGLAARLTAVMERQLRDASHTERIVYAGLAITEWANGFGLGEEGWFTTGIYFALLLKPVPRQRWMSDPLQRNQRPNPVDLIGLLDSGELYKKRKYPTS